MQRHSTEMTVLMVQNPSLQLTRIPDGIDSDSVESRLVRSASGFSAPLSCGTIRAGWGENTAEVTTALCAATQSKALLAGKQQNKCGFITRRAAVTFNPFPEIIAIPSYGRELAQVMVSAPDVHVFILRSADYEGVVVAAERRANSELVAQNE